MFCFIFFLGSVEQLHLIGCGVHTVNCTLYTVTHINTASEEPVRIQYKCLVPIYVFPEMKLFGLVISKQNYNVLASNFHIHVVSDLYSQDRSAYFAAAKYTDWSWTYINSLTDT
jgi:hypothetical protein